MSNRESPTDMSEWAASIQKDVFKHWKENYEDYERGIKVFSSPVFNNPRLLFLGFQPGGSNFEYLRKQFEDGDFSPPENHEYLTESWDLAKVMRNKLFESANHLIEDSVALNHIFYRAPNMATWKSVPETERREMKSYSIDKTVTIVDELNPDNILMFGMSTWNNMQEEYGFETGDIVDRNGYQDGHKLVKFSKISSPQYIGLVHPTNQFGPSDKEFKEARDAILSKIE